MGRLKLNDGPSSAVAQQLSRLRASSPFLLALDESELFGLASHLESVTVADGHKLMLRGQRALWLGVLTKGKARVTLHGREIATLGPGDGLGVAALLREGLRAADATAHGECTVAVLVLDRFAELPAALATSLRLLLVPLICIPVAVVAALAILRSAAALRMPVNFVTPALVCCTVVAISIDYSLFLLAAFAGARQQASGGACRPPRPSTTESPSAAHTIHTHKPTHTHTNT
jgi:hypothetical protein